MDPFLNKKFKDFSRSFQDISYWSRTPFRAKKSLESKSFFSSSTTIWAISSWRFLCVCWVGLSKHWNSRTFQPQPQFQDLQGDFYFKIQLQAMTFKDFHEAYEPCISLGAIAIENVFCVCIAWYKHQRGWENLRQLCKPETESGVCITIKNSPNPSHIYIRLCKDRKKVFYCFYKITFPRKNAKLFVMALIKREILTSHKVLHT